MKDSLPIIDIFETLVCTVGACACAQKEMYEQGFRYVKLIDRCIVALRKNYTFRFV